MLPVRGACEEVGWRGSSRSSRFAGMGVSLSLYYGRGRIVREGWWWVGGGRAVIGIYEIVVLYLWAVVVVLVGICAGRHCVD